MGTPSRWLQELPTRPLKVSGVLCTMQAAPPFWAQTATITKLYLLLGKVMSLTHKLDTLR